MKNQNNSLSFREIRYQDKRKKILQYAARIFAKKGYEKASLEEIASCLKLSKASLYHYVKSKDEVLYLIQMEALEEMLAIIHKITDSDKKPSEKLKDIVVEYIRIATQKHIIGALRQQELILPKKWRKIIIAKRDKFDNECRGVIQEGIETGEFEAVNWEMSYMAMIGALNWTVKWYSPQGTLSVEEISQSMVEFILRGFGISVSD
jgi:TetR/AcrR family transcriptional regulator, cholesterol catabolism regulator